MLPAKEGIVINNKSETEFNVIVTRQDSTSVRFFNRIDDLVNALKSPDNFIVIDEKVANLYSQLLKPILKDGSYIVIQASEKQKSWSNLERILERAIGSNTSRNGAIVAIGGGVITDMSGLAANLYFRGIRSILIPTSLLAMVDAAVGGKVAVNHPHQKNMIGSFYHPSEILVCTAFLSTVLSRHMYSAAGEILKLSILSDTNLFDIIAKAPKHWIRNSNFLDTVVRISIKEKLIMLGKNCFERDLRRPLNLGHSIAHPLEDITDFKIIHGEAVAYGLLIASNISLHRRKLSLCDYKKIYSVAKSFGCTVDTSGFDQEELWNRTRRLTAQRGGNGLLYVLPTGIGSSTVVQNITKKELLTAIRELHEAANIYRIG